MHYQRAKCCLIENIWQTVRINTSFGSVGDQAKTGMQQNLAKDQRLKFSGV